MQLIFATLCGIAGGIAVMLFFIYLELVRINSYAKEIANLLRHRADSANVVEI